MNVPNPPDNEMDDYQALLASGAENARYQRMMAAQKAQAEALRQGGVSPEGQMISGHYVAPSWTQHLGALASNVGAAAMDSRAQKSGAGLESSQAAQNQMVLRALLRNRQMAAPQQPQPTMPAAPQPAMGVSQSDMNGYQGQ